MKHVVYVTLILVMVLLTGCVAYVGLTHLPQEKVQTAAYLGAISSVDVLTANEVRLTMDSSTTGLDFDRCKIVIFAPDNMEVNTIDLESEKWSYMTTGERLTLTTVTLLDWNYDSELDAGDSISLYHTDKLEQGGWTFRMFVDGSSLPNLEEVFVVPGNDTPSGVFRIPDMVNQKEMMMQFGIFDEVVPFYHTSLIIIAPDGQEMSWKFTMGGPNIYSFNDTVWISIVDLQQQHIIDYGDFVRLQSTAGPIPEGVWQFNLLYDYTNGTICHVQISIVDGEAAII